MKSVLATFLSCFLFSLISAQSISIKEFEHFLKIELDDFETEIMSKKFVFNNSKVNISDCNCSTYEYAFGRNIYDTKAKKFIVYYDYNDGKKGLSYQTVDQLEYVKLKKELKVAGYKLNDTLGDDIDNNIFYYYSKGNIDLTLSTSVKKGSIVQNTYFLHFTYK